MSEVHDVRVEPDIDNRTNAAISIYSVVLSLLFFVTLGLLVVYFKWEVAREHDRKMNLVETVELNAQTKAEAEALSGQKSVVKGAKAKSIDEAIKAVASN